MTGQVKEEILARWGELGLRVRHGEIHFDPALLDEAELPEGGALSFTWARVPYSYRRGQATRLRALESGDGATAPNGVSTPAACGRSRLKCLSKTDDQDHAATAARQRHLLLGLPPWPEPGRADLPVAGARSARTSTSCASTGNCCGCTTAACTPSACCEVIRRGPARPFRCMLGAYLGAEMNNFGCPWGGTYSEDAARSQPAENDAELERLIALARLLRRHRLLGGGRQRGHGRLDRPLRAGGADDRATCAGCKREVPPARHLLRELRALAGQAARRWCAELDFISLHTYPVWEYKHIHEALRLHQGQLAQRRAAVSRQADRHHRGRLVHGQQRPRHACPRTRSQELQAIYHQDLMDWTRQAGFLSFVFEAFDEPWKGSTDPLEPEKHWGLFTVDRRPKLVVQALYPELMSDSAAA